MSLVANYSDTDESDQEERDRVGGDVGSKGERKRKNQNLLTADFSDSDNDDEEDDGDVCSELPSHPSLSRSRMPLPSFNGSVLDGGEIPSVFQNPFQAAEEQRKAILEQHVKMTASLQEKEDEKKKRPPCFKFRKGQCHAGDKCRFYHDKGSAPRRGLTGNADTAAGDATTAAPPAVYAATPRLEFTMSKFEFPDEASGVTPNAAAPDEDAAPQRKKKRCGVASGLVPPKRAMNDLTKQRAEERPWTVGT